MLDRTIEVDVSERAERELARRDSPLRLEMELYFSCLIRKRVLVRETLASEFTASVGEHLQIGFRPVMTQKCSVIDTDEDGRPPLTDFPIERPDRYIPHWLRVDYRRDQWQAEFGYLDG
jgi:hypothetical protein